MTLPHAWARLPGPADFLDTILEDLTGRTAVIVGLPGSIPTDAIAVEVAEQVRHRRLGRWEPIRSMEANTRAPEESFAQRCDANPDTAVLWVDATGGEAATSSWMHYIRRLADEPMMPRVCVATYSAITETPIEEKRVRRRRWCEFVTDLDSRALVQRHARRQGQSPAHIELRSAIIAELAGDDLVQAERLARAPLGRLFRDDEHQGMRVWTAQVATLFPLVERERQRLVDAYRSLWRLPHVRQDGTHVTSADRLEIGDLARQLASIQSLQDEHKRAVWLRSVRNALAHGEAVTWSTLISPVALQIVDYRE